MQFDHVALQVPDIAAALVWWRHMVPGSMVLYEDPTWALLDASGARIAFVMQAEHPDHLAFKVSAQQLDRLAAERGATIATHRDDSRSFYVESPGEHRIELIAYPDVVDEDAE